MNGVSNILCLGICPDCCLRRVGAVVLQLLGLIQDYWTGSNGVTDTFLKPKPGVVPYIKQFNARSIFLQDGLQLSYSSGDQLEVDISLSNFGDGALPSSATAHPWRTTTLHATRSAALLRTLQTRASALPPAPPTAPPPSSPRQQALR